MIDPRKPIFDAIRAARGKGFDQMEVGAIDNLLDALNVPRTGQLAARTVSAEGIELIHSFEGLHKVRPDGKIEAYPDPATGGEPWTIGWGSTGSDPFSGGKIKRGTVWTRAQADERFRQHLKQFEQAVAEGVGKSAASQAQFDAMVSLAYNIGAGAFGGSTLLKMHNAGDFDGAAKQFLRWNHAGGKIMAGLTRRREAEMRLYQS
jgi:GH24 family phage-related lysozyme (muramidase)